MFFSINGHLYVFIVGDPCPFVRRELQNNDGGRKADSQTGKPTESIAFTHL